jgi:epoxyqueuosine reductase
VASSITDAGWKARVLCDDNALVDREAARRAGLGWYGKNANLLLPGEGSWFVLGSVVTDAPIVTDAVAVPDGCGSCVRCIDACPTGAIIAPGVLDARRCLAWLVQDRGPFPVEHRAALGARLYGCDDCQEVCPPNRASDRRDAPPEVDGEEAWVSLLGLLASSDEELLDRHGRWYIPRREPRWLRRNALIALGNVASAGDATVATVLERVVDGDDELLAEHASWARQRIAERAGR